MRPSSPVAVSREERARIQDIAGHETASEAAPLLEMLADPSWRVRREVVAALARIGDPAVDGLCALLEHSRDDEARVAAIVDALSTINSPELVHLRMHTLASHPSPAVVADVAQVLGRRRRGEDAEILTSLVDHPDDNVAVAAIEGLGKIGGRAAVDALLASLEKNSFFRIFPAIDVLGRTGDPRVVEPLAKLLDSPTYRLEAVRALGRTGELAAIGPLAPLLAHSSEALVRVAAVSLRDLVTSHQQRYGAEGGAYQALRRAAKNPATIGKLIAALRSAVGDEQLAIATLLGVVGDSSVLAELMPLLDGDEVHASTAAAAIKQLTVDAPEVLGTALQTSDSTRRRVLLPLVMSNNAASAMIAALDDPDPRVRILACRALARTGAVAGVPALFERLADRGPAVAQAAQAAILALGSSQTKDLAMTAAADPRPEVQRAGLRILATLGDEAALPLFLQAAQGPDPRLADVAVGGLALLTSPEALEALLSAAKASDDSTRGAAMRALGRADTTDPRVTPTLREGLSDPRPWVRYYAAQALGRRNTEGVSAELVRLLDDSAGQVRVAAVEALSNVDDPAAFEALARAEQQGDPDMRRAALIGLANSRRSDPEPILLRASESTDAATRMVALSALVQRGSRELVSVLRRMLRDDDELVQRAAANHAASVGSPETTRLLLDALREGLDRDGLIALLARPSEAAVAEIRRALVNADDDHAVELTRILLRMRTEDSIEVLFEAMTLPSVPARKAAATALHVLATPEALQALRDASTHDADPAVRRTCTVLLGS